ncbi:hypothetical protein ACPPVT_16110 [Angustibacter sp. McL0619]|uniref:hypothetical protein n=1 Tax=Angustibacter sp. McL0619 TaxID=3415676 RepID=UPI003CFA1182
MGYEVLGSGAPLADPQFGTPHPTDVVELEPDAAASEPVAGRRPHRRRRRRRPPSARQVAALAVLTLVAGIALGSGWATHRAHRAQQGAEGHRLSVVAVASLTSSFRNGGHGVLTYEVHVRNLGDRPVVVVTGGRPEGTAPVNRTVLVSPTDTDTVPAGQQGEFIAVVMLTCEPGSSIRPQVSLRDTTGLVHVEPLRDRNLDPQLVGAPEVCNHTSD